MASSSLLDTPISLTMSRLYFAAVFLAITIFILYRRRTCRPVSSPPTSRHMEISEMYVYPIKSLRPTPVSRAVATRHGFEYDRRFMILQLTKDGNYKNMAVCYYPKMTQFLTDIVLPEDHTSGKGSILVEFLASTAGQSATLDIPLLPDTKGLDTLEITMHKSSTKAFKMPADYNAWFSSCFGFDVVLAYMGNNLRDVRFDEMMPANATSLLSKLSRKFPILGALASPGEQITFADCAPYLFVSKTSLDAVSSLLSDDEEMDVTKFRSNIVIKGAEKAWEEDYWGKVNINGAEIVMKHNCGRCQSINIDYKTGLPGTGPSGEVLKRMQKDRRVDLGNKYSPVFGRYCFWSAKNGVKALSVGDKVSVSQVNSERTKWSWEI